MARVQLGEFELPERPGNRFRSSIPSSSAPSAPLLSSSVPSSSLSIPAATAVSSSSSSLPSLSLAQPSLRSLAVQARPLRSQPLVSTPRSFFTRLIHQLSVFASKTGTYTRIFLQIAAVMALIYGFFHFRRFQEQMAPLRSSSESKEEKKPVPDPLKLLVRRRFQKLSSTWFFEPMGKEVQELVSAGIYSKEEAMVQLMCNELETATAELIVLRGALPSRLPSAPPDNLPPTLFAQAPKPQ